MQALICEDEPLARTALRTYLRDVNWLEVVAEAATGSEAMRMIHKHEPELVFMDVRLPGVSGLEVLDAIHHRPAIVFTTAFDEYALPAFELGAVDYLLKPFGKARLLETLDRVRVRLLGEGLLPGRSTESEQPRRQATGRIFARARGALVPIPMTAMIRAEATRGGSWVFTDQGRFDVDYTLAELEERVSSADFVRVHRSHLINLAHVASIRRHDERRLTVRLSDGGEVVASRGGSRLLRDLTS